MEEEIVQYRIFAVERFKNGESPESICASLGKSRIWLYKWIRSIVKMTTHGVKVDLGALIQSNVVRH